jgi:hypothetical protein
VTPSCDQIKAASKDVAWEYVALHAAALEMVKPPYPAWPVNHVLQEAFLVHVRSLAEFFHTGVHNFTGTQPARDKDNVYAVDFCFAVTWGPDPFASSSRLITAINKTLSHLTYSRYSASSTHVAFDACLHAHGTLRLIRETWADFLKGVKRDYLSPQHEEDIQYWLRKHTEADVKYGLFGDFGNRFDTLVSAAGWHLNERL